MEPDLTRTAKQPFHPQLVYVVIQRTTCHGCVAKHSIYFVGAWARSDKPESQSIHRCSIHPTLGHPRCGTRFGENCKTTKPSSGWCMLLHKEQHAMDILPPISFVGAWARSDKSGTQSIHYDPVHPSLRAPKLWDQIW